MVTQKQHTDLGLHTNPPHVIRTHSTYMSDYVLRSNINITWVKHKRHVSPQLCSRDSMKHDRPPPPPPPMLPPFSVSFEAFVGFQILPVDADSFFLLPIYPQSTKDLWQFLIWCMWRWGVCALPRPTVSMNDLMAGDAGPQLEARGLGTRTGLMFPVLLKPQLQMLMLQPVEDLTVITRLNSACVVGPGIP